jgi:DNA polymerase I-like protein with 3'-5' exonuclease and polymerase domains
LKNQRFFKLQEADMIVQTATIEPGSLNVEEQHQTYCALDSMLTLEILENINREHPGGAEPIYSFERALQAPLLEMALHGFLVDGLDRHRMEIQVKKQVVESRRVLNELAQPVWGKELNPRSHTQLSEFFYKTMKIPEIWLSFKGERRLSVNREALEKIDEYMYARPLVSLILSCRDLYKQLDVLTEEIDEDGRHRTSYNIGGTECIAGDSLVWTKGGLRQIKEIYISPHEIAVWNGKEFHTPVRKVYYKNREGFHITLEGGYELKCSSNHPVATQRGFIEAKNLLPTDSVGMMTGLPSLFGQHVLPRGGFFDQMSEDFCEFYGMILADGSLNVNEEHKRCRLSNSDRLIRARFLELAKTTFGVVGGESGDEAWFSSTQVCTWLKNLGFPADSGLGSASIKTIPAELMRGKPNLLRALLRGITLDTHITDKGLMFGTQSPAMREQIQQILMILGIVSIKLSMGNSIKLNVPRSYCGRFISIVGFVSNEKALKLAYLLNERSQWHEHKLFGRLSYTPIISIAPWTGDVYDLTMPSDSPPHYVAQGMLIHNTGRLSSSTSVLGTGGNAQNIAPELRRVFISDPGWKLCSIDLEQVEARDVGFLCGSLFADWSLLNSCESGDFHTNNCKLIWPDQPWPSDPLGCRQLAERFPVYRDWTMRDLAKRGGHLSNYSGTAWTMSRVLKLPMKVCVEFQARYCRGSANSNIRPAYPALRQYWTWIADRLQTEGHITTPFGRKRHFFGDQRSDATLREAIAFVPQSMTADRTNLWLWKMWATLKDRIQLLAQTHDSITFQFREDDPDPDEIIDAVINLLNEIKLVDPKSQRVYVAPGAAKVGWNWAPYVHNSGEARVGNPAGLIKWRRGTQDKRSRPSGLDRLIGG